MKFLKEKREDLIQYQYIRNQLKDNFDGLSIFVWTCTEKNKEEDQREAGINQQNTGEEENELVNWGNYEQGIENSSARDDIEPQYPSE